MSEPVADPVVAADIARRKRMQFAAQALAVAGMGMGKDAEAYEELEGPIAIDGPTLHKASGYWWSCATTVMAIMRLAGVEDPLLFTRYVIGKAMSWDVEIGEHAHAFRTWGDKNDDGSDAMPALGDFTIVGPGGFHIFTIASDVVIPGHFDTVEGGQADAGGMCIKKLSRQLFMASGALYAGNSIAPSTRVYGWIDCTRLPLAAVL